MGISKEEGKQKVVKLVDRFKNNIDEYKKSTYNETQVRREFIDPFFEALGWDVANKRGHAEQYKEVIHEFSQKTKDVVEAPDYLFRLMTANKFFVEAKKPSVNIKSDINPAFQLRRYAWSGKLPLSILTDFEEFSVYDCRIRPHKNDKASVGRIMYFTYEEYAERWDEIYSLFARDEIPKGAFDRYAVSNKNKKGTSEVDDEFLKEIEDWRNSLAKNIALRNEKLSNRELNFAVQKTIDRLIFLRICEDRGIEDYGQLMNLMNGANIYARLKQIYTRADEKYNSGLFYFDEEKNRGGYPDTLTFNLSIDDKVLKDIIKHLYYPESPYEFSMISADILGHVYEQFLGKVIRLTAGHRAVIEEKPEVKKAGGVYYTPTYIVDYIVKNTLGEKLDEIKKDFKEGDSGSLKKALKLAEEIKVLDPACGSGSFLLGAYQYLLDWHIEIYATFDIEKLLTKRDSPVYESGNGGLKLTTAERKRILLNNIYGVDIDNQAVEVTKLSLMLKVLEGETNETLASQMSMFKQRALPDLSSNIKCGNSLIGPDFYEQLDLNFLDDEERYRINVFDWNEEFKSIMSGGGFSVVIGNPPYIQSRSEQISKHEKEFYNLKFYSTEYQINTFGLFIEKGFKLLGIDGLISFIVPNYWLATKYDYKLRELMFHQYQILELLNVYNVFKNATVDTLVFLGTSSQKKDNVIVKSISNSYKTISERLNAVNAKHWFIEKKVSVQNDKDIQISFKHEFNLSANKSLGDFFDFKFGMKPYQVGKGKPAQTKNTLVNKEYNSNSKLDKSYFPLLKAGDVKRYSIDWRSGWIKYGDHLAEPRTINLFEGDRIVLRRIIAKSNIEGCFLNSTYICNTDVITLRFNQSIEKDYYYFLGVILSRLTTFYIRSKNVNLDRAAFPKINTNTLSLLPIPYYENNAKFDKQKLRISELSKNITTLYFTLPNKNNPQEKEILQRQINALDNQIDKLVYELYGLTEEEIKIVEGK